MLLSFNRTNVELKYFLLPHPVSSIRAFNRTNVELKYATGLTMTAGYNDAVSMSGGFKGAGELTKGTVATS